MFFRLFDGAPCGGHVRVAEGRPGADQAGRDAEHQPGDRSVPGSRGLRWGHDFNVGWMNINQANLSVVNGGTTSMRRPAGPATSCRC